MKPSVFSTVASDVAALPERSFVRGSDFSAPRGPVDTALSRLCAAGALSRVRKGLYWKGADTAFGMSRPSPGDVALEVAGPGSGPAGVAAARWLGLTTQVPAIFATAVPIRAPKGWRSVTFCQRTFSRRLRDLSPTEVALIEVLRAGPAVVDGPWESVGVTASRLAAEGSIRMKMVEEQIGDEPHRATRERWKELIVGQPSLIPPTAA